MTVLAITLVAVAELVPLPDLRVAGLPWVVPLVFLLAAAASTALFGLRRRHGVGLAVLVAVAIGVLAYADARTVPIHAPARPAIHGVLIAAFVGLPVLVGTAVGTSFTPGRRHRPSRTTGAC